MRIRKNIQRRSRILTHLLLNYLYWLLLKNINTLETLSGTPIYSALALDNVHFEYYLVGGLTLGYLMSFGVFRKT
jgi:hypothetical protein